MIGVRSPIETPVSLLDVIRRHRLAVAGMFVVIALGALAYRQSLRPPAVSEARVVVSNPALDASGVGASDPVAYFADQLALARLPVVTSEVITSTSIPGEVNDVQVTSDPQSDTIVFTTSLPRGNDDASVDLTNRVVANYVAHSDRARQQQATVALSAITASLQSLATSPVGQSAGADGLRLQLTSQQAALAEEAQTPQGQLTVSPAELQPSGVPGGSRLLLAVLLGGGLLAVVIALARDGSARRLTRSEDAAEATGLPIVGILPLGRRRRVAAHATWVALIPPGGLLLVAVAENGLRGKPGADGEQLVELFGPAEPNILLVTLPALRADFERQSDADAPAVLVAGPRTSRQALLEAQDDLSRAKIDVMGVMWSEPKARRSARSIIGASRATGVPAVEKLRRPSAVTQ